MKNGPAFLPFCWPRHTLSRWLWDADYCSIFSALADCGVWKTEWHQNGCVCVDVTIVQPHEKAKQNCTSQRNRRSSGSPFCNLDFSFLFPNPTALQKSTTENNHVCNTWRHLCWGYNRTSASCFGRGLTWAAGLWWPFAWLQSLPACRKLALFDDEDDDWDSCGNVPFDTTVVGGDLLRFAVEVGLGSCEYGGVVATGIDPFFTTGRDGFLLTAGRYEDPPFLESLRFESIVLSFLSTEPLSVPLTGCMTATAGSLGSLNCTGGSTYPFLPLVLIFVLGMLSLSMAWFS